MNFSRLMKFVGQLRFFAQCGVSGDVAVVVVVIAAVVIVVVAVVVVIIVVIVISIVVVVTEIQWRRNSVKREW